MMDRLTRLRVRLRHHLHAPRRLWWRFNAQPFEDVLLRLGLLSSLAAVLLCAAADFAARLSAELTLLWLAGEAAFLAPLCLYFGWRLLKISEA